jgi:hypothetical protein
MLGAALLAVLAAGIGAPAATIRYAVEVGAAATRVRAAG